MPAPLDRRDLLIYGGGLLAAGPLASAWHPWAAGAGRRTRHVILIALAGGVRTRDTLGAPENAPVLQAMAQQGVLYTRVRCSSLGHVGATLALFTGIGEPRGLRESGSGPDPTLFEYVRRAAGLDASSVWISAAGGSQQVNYASSLHADYGPRFGASTLAGGSSSRELGGLLHELVGAGPEIRPENAVDARAIRAARGLLALFEPRLTAIVLRQADVAHRSYAAYVEVIRQNDAEIGRLWSAVQADPALRETTAFVVVPEFGRDRELNSRRGLDHGDGSDDVNYVAAVCWGPDFARGRVVTEDVRAIDVCPTVCDLLGVDAPHARGRPLPRLLA